MADNKQSVQEHLRLSVPSDADIYRLARRLAIVLFLGTIAFAAFYTLDRWRPATPPIVDQQLTSLEEAVRADPNDLAVRGQLADTYLAKGRFADALAQYDTIIATGQELEPAHMGRAQTLVGLNRLDEARADYEAVVDIAKGGEMAAVDPTLEAAYYGLGSIALQQGKAAEAVPFLQAALAIQRSDADAMFLLGKAYLATGQVDDAITELRAAVVFVPVGWSAPYEAMAEAFTTQGRADLASWATAMAKLNAGSTDGVEAQLKALADTEAAVDAAVGLGLLYETRGDNAAAIDSYTKALSLDPGNNAARFALGRIGPLPTVAPSAAPSTSPSGGDR
jgi:tetratricopeptide (TPR) repeat protein